MYQLAEAIVDVPVCKLTVSPDNALIHADIDFAGRDSWFLEDIRNQGILMPLIIHEDYEVGEGHRRLAAAKKLKLERVPCLMAKGADKKTVFNSAQLGRHLTLFAKCAMHRRRIEELVQRGKDHQQRNLRQASDHQGRGDADPLQQDWIRMEEVLGVSRDSLIRGVKLLSTIEALTRDPSFDEKQRGLRICAIFRCRGLNPALRMMGEKIKPGSGDTEPDVGAWQADDGEPVPAKPARKTVKKCAAKDGPAVIEMLPLEHVVGYVCEIRRTFSHHGIRGPEVDSALALILDAVTSSTSGALAA